MLYQALDDQKWQLTGGENPSYSMVESAKS